MWYVVQVMTGKELHCCNLCRRYITREIYKEMFVPQYIQKKRYQGTWHQEEKILFPGYFFVDTAQIDTVIDELSRVPEMTKVLRTGETVTAITVEEQQYLTDMLDADYMVQMSTGFMVGDKICITDGPLRNYQGYIKKIDRHKRVADLQINFFGRMTPVRVGFEVLAKMTEEEFQCMKEETIEADSADIISSSEDDIVKVSRVKVVKGIFAGMTGVILSENEIKKEMKVSLNLFGEPTSVTFAQDEVSRT